MLLDRQLLSVKLCYDVIRHYSSDLSCSKAYLFIYFFYYDFLKLYQAWKWPPNSESSLRSHRLPSHLTDPSTAPAVQSNWEEAGQLESALPSLCFGSPGLSSALLGGLAGLLCRFWVFSHHPVLLAHWPCLLQLFFLFFCLCLELCVSFYILVGEGWGSWTSWLQRNYIDLIASNLLISQKI